MSQQDDGKYHPTVMDPKPGEKYVEYSKDGDDGERKSTVDSGLDVEKRHKGQIYISKVVYPAPTHNLHVGDRLVALNGHKIEHFRNLDEIRNEFESKNVVKLLVDPTLLHD
jgi:membrane-associated protease RseP (regulator of RpoE activity)